MSNYEERHKETVHIVHFSYALIIYVCETYKIMTKNPASFVIKNAPNLVGIKSALSCSQVNSVCTIHVYETQ